MQTTEYRIRVEALNAEGYVVAGFEQRIAQDTIRKSRPKLLARFIEGVVRTFLLGHKGAEQALPKRRKRKPMKMRAAIPFDTMNSQPFSEGPQHD